MLYYNQPTDFIKSFSADNNNLTQTIKISSRKGAVFN